MNPTGEQLRDNGMAAVESATPDDWKDRADSVIRACAASGRDFTAEDVRTWAGDPPRPNAIGARFMAALKSRIIERTGWVRAKRAEAHARAIPVYRGTGAVT
jgi:hypothetical protein